MTRKLSRRRYVVGTGTALTTGVLAGCSGGGDSGDGGDGAETIDDVPSEIDDYLTENEARLYDGALLDYTGEDEVAVDVGAGDVGFAFDPAAIRIDAGTTVVWEWTGEGGAHNVASAEGSASDFDSGDAVDDESETFEQSFDDAGIQLYYCTPHESNGMHGAIEVVE
ncbi:halocyanin domain-containing protein [Halorubrum sp. 48-1-W]|uniref:halocyanin domain-containing protein n=1 Tax=Halorubrum sp. 48-1-W TaxID=2249761 RepID=UPI000DCB4A7D|nr:halocyanin domain-containing protein [Halorubrum sp. 48-1-W]RAW46096.1 halocyanin domain-containing protein [Halorubrum sp. 48-1-W]